MPRRPNPKMKRNTGAIFLAGVDSRQKSKTLPFRIKNFGWGINIRRSK